MKRTVFFISDGTGITAETLGNSLLTQFDKVEFDYITMPHIDNVTKAKAALHSLEQASVRDGQKPLVFSTLVNSEIRDILQDAPALILDFFQTFLNPLEQELGMQSTHTIGKTHGLNDYKNYMLRINAVNYALANDDGANQHDYNKADVILIGVSRCGKTPACLYLALQFGLNAANYPLTEDEMTSMQLPGILKGLRKKLFGLTIEITRLQQIRQERRPNSRYASLRQCQYEIREAEAMFRRERIPHLNTTRRSVEEIATAIMTNVGVKRKLA